jgi:hypothetical protein
LPVEIISGLRQTAREVFTSPSGLRPVSGQVDAETREMLAQIGYL